MRTTLRASLALAASLGLATAALAQAAAPAAEPPSTGAPKASSSARTQCRADIDSRSLTGPERKAAMRDCMKPQREACREQAIGKGMAKGPDRKAFMHQCLEGAVARTP